MYAETERRSHAEPLKRTALRIWITLCINLFSLYVKQYGRWKDSRREPLDISFPGRSLGTRGQRLIRRPFDTKLRRYLNDELNGPQVVPDLVKSGIANSRPVVD